MARVTSDEVVGILGGNYDTENAPSLLPFITTANVMTSRVVTCAASKDITIDAETLAQIEMYLAAHFYGHSDQMYTSRSTQSASGSFQGQTGKGLESTLYGQTALMLDPSGCLNAIANKNRASMVWLGTDTEDGAL